MNKLSVAQPVRFFFTVHLGLSPHLGTERSYNHGIILGFNMCYSFSGKRYACR